MTEQDDDFAALFEASLKAPRIERGQTIEGRIVAIRADEAFVDVGGKGEATISVDELKDEEGQLEVAVGDRIEAVVVSTEKGLRLSRRLARGAASDRQIDDAFRAGLPVEGKVEGPIKGGFEVRVGRQRAFCPISQIDIVRNTDPADHVGRVYAFRIIEYKDDGRNLVVSRRALLEEEQRAQADEVRRAVVPGAIVKGRVASVVEFGAFVDLGGGVQGLLHRSEMGWSAVPDILDVVRPGDEVTVKVVRVEQDTERIALSLKALLDDPWGTVPDRYAVGQVVSGRVTRLAQFGAFVEIEPGVEALAHLSTFPPGGGAGGWAKRVPVGTVGEFEILTVDLEKKRIGVALVAAAGEEGRPGPRVQGDVVVGASLTGTVQRHETFGVFVFLGPGRVGLLPNAETGLAREADIKSTLPVGAEVEVVVLEVDAEGRRIRLSRRAAMAADEAAEVREYTERAEAPPGDRLGSMADKLRGALERRRS